ncbi:aldose 1-epimerase [Vibrio astriarenae]|nr:aldose 1-epimerase [Vibrio sp. C7]
MFNNNNTILDTTWGDYRLYTLTNELGTRIEISDLGAAIVNFFVKDGYSQERNIVLGYQDSANYINSETYISGIVGPWGNRIEGGTFSLNNETVQLELNEEDNHLHGAGCNLHKRRWDVIATAAQGITFQTTVSKGDGGYPANITLMVTYRLSNDNELTINVWAEPDEKCPLNVTHHFYFNLFGRKNDVTSHVVAIDADQFWRTDQNLIPKERATTYQTPMDFLQPKPIGIGLKSQNHDILQASGYDHCFILNGQGLRSVGWVFEPKIGLSLEILTDKPAMQFYTGNHLNEERDSFGKYSGVCFEPQHFPNQVNMDGLFEDVMYDEDRPYSSTTIYKIQVEKTNSSLFLN